MNIKQLGQKIYWWWLNHRYYFRHQLDTLEQLKFDFQYREHKEWLKLAWGIGVSGFDFDEDDFDRQLNEAINNGSFWQ